MIKEIVSIIMGVYNCEGTLSEAINSIIAQTFSQWKLIICDDGSTDASLQIAKEWADRFPEKIIVIKNKRNRGLNYTLNHCLKYVDTNYVARMDADDISHPLRLEKEVSFLDTHPQYAIVSCPMIYFDEKGEWGKGSASGEVQKSDFIRGTPFCHAPCMVRKEAYDAVGGYTVDKTLLRMEDYDLWIKMYAKGYKGYNLSEHLYMMRDDRKATSRRKYRYRINEARVRIKAIHELQLSKYSYIYVLRPLLVGLLPVKIYEFLHKKRIEEGG